MDIPTYKIAWDNDEDGGLYGVSIVDEAANEFEFVSMSKDSVKLKTENKEKQIVTGVVLVPNQLIYRDNAKRGKHYIVFEEDIIEKLSHQFFRLDSDKNSWFQHDYSKKLEDNVVVESWLINDPEKDKAVTLGFEGLPKGTWMMSIKLSDKDWNEYVKTGQAKGFSIDGFLKHELITDNKSEMEMTKMLKQFKNFLTQMEKDKEDKVEMISVESDGVVYTVESLEEGKVVTIKDEEGNDVPFVEGSFTNEDMIYTTNDKGEIISIVSEDAKEVEVEEDDVPLEDQKNSIEKMLEEDPEFKQLLEDLFAMDEDEMVNMVIQKAEKEETVKEKFEFLFLEKNKALETKLTESEKALEDLKAEKLELEKQLEKEPASTKLKAQNVKSNKEKTQETALEAIKRINSQRKQ